MGGVSLGLSVNRISYRRFSSFSLLLSIRQLLCFSPSLPFRFIGVLARLGPMALLLFFISVIL